MSYIHCNLKGGLCNMLFQIAATYAFALDAGCESNFPNLVENCKFIDEMKSDPKHGGCDRTYGVESLKVLHRLNAKPIPSGDNPKYEGFGFQYEAKKIAPNSIVNGFFQSELYFARHRDAVLGLFDFSFIDRDDLFRKYPFLSSQKLTAIHVRRGDFVHKPLCHPPQPLSYYERGIRHLEDQTDIFVVFSDDIEWCKQNMHGKRFFFVENEKDYIELYIMSLCHNYIISNSSFGWWGAWLSNNQTKTVIAPQVWFGPILASHDISNLLPPTWLKM